MMTPKFIGFCIFLFVTSALVSLSFRDNGAHLRTWLPKTPSHRQPAIKEKPVGPKIAYATFLSATMASEDETLPDEADGYFLGTRVMLYQLLHSRIAGNSSIPVIVLVTEDVSPRKRARLEKDGATVIVVEKLKDVGCDEGQEALYPVGRDDRRIGVADRSDEVLSRRVRLWGQGSSADSPDCTTPDLRRTPARQR